MRFCCLKVLFLIIFTTTGAKNIIPYKYRGLCHKEVHYIKTAVAQVCKLEDSSYVGLVCR